MMGTMLGVEAGIRGAMLAMAADKRGSMRVVGTADL